jgi:hypothetical protein
MYELPLFLFAGGLALFVALMGWSDQIRNPQRDVRELEIEFRKKTNIKNKDLNPIIKNFYQDKENIDASFFGEIKSITKLLVGGKLKGEENVKLLENFKTANGYVDKMEGLYRWKYRGVIFLTFLFFVGGMVLLLLPTYAISLECVSIDYSIILVSIPVIVIFILIFFAIRVSVLEDKFKSILKELLNNL